MKKPRTIGYGILAVVLMLAFTACSNPMEPQTTGSISGQITVDGSGAMDFIVGIASTSMVSETDEYGRFRINDVPTGGHRLIVVRKTFSAFFAETVYVSAGLETELQQKNIASADLVVPVTGVTLASDIAMTPNQSLTLTATVLPENATVRTVLWNSSDTNVVTIDMLTGELTAHTVGHATITVLTAQGNRTATARVTVTYYTLEPDKPTTAGNPSEFAGSLLILQAAGTAGGAVGRTFIEIYNNTNADINLDGFSLQWAGGTSDWNVIRLTGQTIPANSSFLVVGNQGSEPGRLQIPDTDADMVVDFTLSNRAFRVAIMESYNRLTVPNPSDMDGIGIDLRPLMPPAGTSSDGTIGNTAEGLVDLLGVVNERGDARDVIHGAEVAPAFRISNQVAIRRGSLVDTDNNFNDFRMIDYRVWVVSNPYRLTDEQVDIFRPRGSIFQPRNVEFPEPGASQPQGPRRVLLTDTNNNATDFSQADFRGHWEGTARVPNAELYRIWPRNASMGSWNPITGIPAVHPTVRNPATGIVEFQMLGTNE